MEDSVVNRMERGEINSVHAEKNTILLTADDGVRSSSTTTARGSVDSSNDSSKVVHSWPRLRRLTRSIAHLATSSDPGGTGPIPPGTSLVKCLDDCPEGYPRLAALLDSDENFMLYRKFGFLQARLLLYKQDQLRELEGDLDQIDEVDERLKPKWLRSRARDDVENDERKRLLEEIEKKFMEYTQLLTVARDLASFDRPLARDYWSIRNYFDQRAPLVEGESYIYYKEDIVTLKPGREYSWLDTFVERMVKKLPYKIVQYILSSPELRAKVNPKSSGVVLYHWERIEVIVALINTLVIVAILIIPIYILFYLTNGPQNDHSIAVIISVLLVFTMAFSGVLILFTKAKRHEILAATAAYSAVLVVFIGNVGKLSN